MLVVVLVAIALVAPPLWGQSSGGRASMVVTFKERHQHIGPGHRIRLAELVDH